MVTMRHTSDHQTPWGWGRIILIWNTEDGSCAFGICDCRNKICKNNWCTLVELWLRTLDGDNEDLNSLLCVHGVDTWGWCNGHGIIAHSVFWGRLRHIPSAGTPPHLTPGHWEPWEERDFLVESRQMTLVDVTHINQLMHHGAKSIIPCFLWTVILSLWSRRRIILHQLFLLRELGGGKFGLLFERTEGTLKQWTDGSTELKATG